MAQAGLMSRQASVAPGATIPAEARDCVIS